MSEQAGKQQQTVADALAQRVEARKGTGPHGRGRCASWGSRIFCHHGEVQAQGARFVLRSEEREDQVAVLEQGAVVEALRAGEMSAIRADGRIRASDELVPVARSR